MIKRFVRRTLPLSLTLLVVVGLLAWGVAVKSTTGRAEPTRTSAERDVTRDATVQIWEDGSGRFLAGTTTVDGQHWDLTGRAFCLVGEGCEDTGLPDSLKWYGPYDGHDRCWLIQGDTSVLFCDDGYVTTS